MIGFLKIVAAFLVAIVIFVILVIVVIRWKLRKFLKSMMNTAAEAATSAVPPFRITLRPKNDGEDEDEVWVHEDDMQRLTAEFEAAGFTQIGDFEGEGLPLELRGFQHQEHQIYGVIYDHAFAGCWCDVVRRYADDSAWTVSSAKEHGMDPPPNHHPVFLPGQTVAELVEKLLEVSPQEGLQKAGADMFVKRFETAYAREMDWRIERGGPTEAEIRRIAAKDEQECPPENIEQVQNQWRTAIAEFLSDRVLKAWRKQSGIPNREYQQIAEGLLVIHERMLPGQLLELADQEILYENYMDDDGDDSGTDKREKLLAKLKQWCSEDSPIGAFRKLLKVCNEESEWEQTGQADRPVKAEIWIRAGYGDSEADDDDEDDDYEPPDDDDQNL